MSRARLFLFFILACAVAPTVGFADLMLRGRPAKPLAGRGLPFRYGKRLPKSISIAAGVPLTGVGDTTGGFGDVLANIHMAKAFKRDYPGIRIQLVVWLMDQSDPDIASVAEIIRKTMPAVDPNRHYVAQAVDGIDIYVVPHHGPERMAAAIREGKPIIPKCEFAVQYSANAHPRQDILEATGERWFSFFEPGAQTNMIVKDRSFANGLLTTGIYGIAPNADIAETKRRLARWTRKTTGLKVVSGRDVFAYAYTKETASSQAYQRAVVRLAAQNPDKRYFVYVKKSAAIGKKVAPNVHVIPLDGFPMATGNDLIVASDLAPLVTGDSSFSTAVLSTRKERAFLYESLQWKDTYIANLKTTLEKRGSDIDPTKIFLDGASDEARILAAFEDPDIGRKVHVLLKSLQKRSNLVENTLKLHALVELYGENIFSVATREPKRFMNKLLSDWFATEDADGYLKRVSARMRSAETAEEVLEAAAQKIFVGAPLEKTEEIAFYRAMRAAMTDKDPQVMARVAEVYHLVMSENPAFQSLVSGSLNREKYASQHRNLFKDFWAKVQVRQTRTKSFATLHREGCRFNLKRVPFEL